MTPITAQHSRNRPGGTHIATMHTLSRTLYSYIAMLLFILYLFIYTDVPLGTSGLRHVYLV